MPDWMQVMAKMAEGRVVRSSALAPLLWLMLVLFIGIGATLALGGPAWLAIGIFVLVCGVFVIIMIMYCVYARTSPDMLRSESYVIRKMEIERGYIGDSVQGVLEGPEADETGEPNQLTGGDSGG